MTPTLLAPRRAAPARPRRYSLSRKPRRWAGVAFGLLIGMLAVCHGCHLGDHDDELSVHGGTVRNEDKASGDPSSH